MYWWYIRGFVLCSHGTSSYLFLPTGIIAYADCEINMLRLCKSVIFPPFVLKMSQNHIFKASHTSRNGLKSTLSRLHGINILLSFFKINQGEHSKIPCPVGYYFRTGDFGLHYRIFINQDWVILSLVRIFCLSDLICQGIHRKYLLHRSSSCLHSQEGIRPAPWTSQGKEGRDCGSHIS